MRIVSLVPSISETLLAAGANVVGVTRYCNRDDLPLIGGTKDPDLAKIASLEPDLVILDRHENLLADYELLRQAKMDTFATSISSISDMNRDFTELSKIINLELPKFDDFIRLPSRIKVLVPIWRRPYMALGPDTYGGDLLSHLGFEVIGGETTYSKIDLEDFVGRVDLIIAPSEPYKFTKRQLPELGAISEVIFVDGQDLFWWGSRTKVALQRLARKLSAY
ncbi:helical backbone metal receptor [Acidithrix sp. C25]|uniref:helical backbone metal receptor n=1 Tax=Acidithrix sp. C25 TaxID=1671482 RepID=UPI00191BA8EE|nr:helical backbone metal receptor [Acidithrix sp. C25]